MPERKFNPNKYRFSLMHFEKDDEIKGINNHISFNDYGYDPRLSCRWSSDLYEKKYPSNSPYSAFNNNPVIYKDIDGRDWIISTKYDKDGNKTIFMTLNAVILDGTTSRTVDVNRFKNAVESQVKETFSVSFQEASKYKTVNLNNGLDMNSNNLLVAENFRDVNVEVKVNLRIIKNNSEIKSNEHLIKIVDNNSNELSVSATAQTNKIGGKEIRIKERYISDIISDVNKKTVVHELGHTLGLRHVDKMVETPRDFLSSFLGGSGNAQYCGPASRNSNNMMLSRYNRSANKINSEQVKTVVKNHDKGKVNLK